VLKILLKIQGEVSVKSKVGEGSVFGFILPAPETD
jgi:signal transduction histidine kinase